MLSFRPLKLPVDLDITSCSDLVLNIFQLAFVQDNAMIAQLGNDIGVGHDDNRLPEFLC